MSARLVTAVSLVLLTFFVFNVCVFGVLLSARLHFHQHAQHEGLKTKSSKAIVELRFHRDIVEKYHPDFLWVKDWEFRWKGEMYDIEESVRNGDFYVFHVKHDSKEDLIRKQLDRHAQDESKKRDAQSKKNLKCGSEYCQSIKQFHPLNSGVVCRRVAIQLPQYNFCQPVPAPPPRFA